MYSPTGAPQSGFIKHNFLKNKEGADLFSTTFEHKSGAGFSLIEVLIAIAVTSVLLILIGSSLRSIHQSFVASDFKARAVALALEGLEITAEIQNDAFACICGAPGVVCTGSPYTQCEIVGQQTCALRPGYNSCWVEHPVTASNNGPLRLAISGGAWNLIDGTETITPESGFTFTRSIAITNLCRNGLSGVIEDCGTGTIDVNSKKIQVNMSWNETGNTKSLQLEQILTGWKNMP